MKKKDTFKNRLTTAMNIRNIKAVEIHENTGLSKARISQYMNGTYEAKNDGLSILSDALGVSELWLMGYDVPMDPNVPLNNISKTSKGFKIPVLGKVVAGVPIEAIEEILDYEEIDPELAKTGEFFALQIKGSSMEPKFSQGDVVIVKKQPDVETGEIAVVLVNGNDATVKKIKKEEKGITLIATNATEYEPQFYSNEEIEKLPLSIIGKVIELRAKF